MFKKFSEKGKYVKKAYLSILEKRVYLNRPGMELFGDVKRFDVEYDEQAGAVRLVPSLSGHYAASRSASGSAVITAKLSRVMEKGIYYHVGEGIFAAAYNN